MLVLDRIKTKKAFGKQKRYLSWRKKEKLQQEGGEFIC